MATNNAPKFNSDDDAIWRRTKLIPFNTVFVGQDEVPDMARTVLAPERDGILNWLLAGLQDFLAHGLGEPADIREIAEDQRIQSDSVARFLDDKITDGMLVIGTGEQVRTSELFSMYAEWARQMGERSLGNRRFNNRVSSNHPELEVVKLSGYPHWRGLGRNRHVGVLGTIPHLPID
jgi:putative DNA primase/helicase